MKLTGQRGHASTGHRHWLCIAYAFPPMARSGTHRTLGFIRHLDEWGWRATVITADPGTEAQDPALLDRVPSRTRVLRVPWIDPIARLKTLVARFRRVKGKVPTTKFDGERSTNNPPTSILGYRSWAVDWFTRLLLMPDSRASWILPAVAQGLRCVRQARPELIYSTSPYVSTHLAGLLLHFWTRIPWVADFRDPWRDNPFRRIPYRFLDRLDHRLERWVLRHASHVVFNSPTARASACARYRFLTDKSSTILNGFDADLVPQAPRGPRSGDDKIVFAHAGEFYGARSPIPFLRGLHRLVQKSPDYRNQIRVRLMGRDEFEGRSLVELAAQHGVGDMVEACGRKNHAQTLESLSRSDVLLLVSASGPGSDLQIPNKLFEYIALGRPVLGLLSCQNPAVDILQDARIPWVHCPSNDAYAICNAIREAVPLSRLPSSPTDTATQAAVGRFDRRRFAIQLRDLFESICQFEQSKRIATAASTGLPGRATGWGRIAGA